MALLHSFGGLAVFDAAIAVLEWLASMNLYPLYSAWNITNLVLYIFWNFYAFMKLRKVVSFFKAAAFALMISFAWVSIIDEIWFILNIDLFWHLGVLGFLERWAWKIFYSYFAIKLSRKYFGRIINISKKTVLLLAALFISLAPPLLMFKPYTFKNWYLTGYPLWFMYIFADLLQWSINTACFMSLWRKAPKQVEESLAFGVREFVRMWRGWLVSFKNKPKGVSILRSLNPLKTPLFYDMVRKTCKHLGMSFPGKLAPINSEKCSMKLPDGNVLTYNWEESPQVIDTVKKVYGGLYGPKPEGIVVDVGAHIGIYSLFASEHAKVFAIEPEHSNFETLMNNANSKISCSRLAISEQGGPIRLFMSDLTSSCSIKPEGLLSESQFVLSMPLNMFLDCEQITRVDMLKIDVEGAEMDVLRSGEEALKDGRVSNITVACYHYPEERQEVVDYLRSLGYKVQTDRSVEIIVNARLI